MTPTDKMIRYVILSAVLALTATTIFIWMLVASSFSAPKMKVAFLDVGQGDSVLITSPTGKKVLIDGGAGSAVLSQLSKETPWYDRKIDVIIATHPDADHIGGLIDVLDRYEVAHVVESSVLGDTALWDRFQDAIKDEGIEVVKAMRGQVFDIGGGAYLEILFPDRPLLYVDKNTASIVARVVYGDTSFLLTGDSPTSIEEYLVSLDRAALASSVLKAGHHGSKTSTAPLYIGYVNPESVVFSRGCNNRYGHPSEETLKILNKFNKVLYDTCEEGTIRYISDGLNVERQ